MGSSNLIDVYMQIEYEKRLGRVGKAVKIDVRLVPVGVKTNRLIFYWPRTRYKEVESVVLPEEKRGIIAQIYFAFDSSLLDHKDKEVIGDAIQILKKKLKEKKAKDVIVKGYTDVIGTRDYNLDLSERRAKEVADILKSSLADTGGLILEVGLGEQGTDKDTEDIRSRNRRVDISYYQPTYEKGRQPKRPRRGWSEMPWTEQELQSFKNEEFNEVSKYPVWENQESELIRVLEERYFIGEQVIKNWNNRYGKWYDSGLNDKWANWFCNRMLDSCPNGYPISLNRQGRKQLWEDFWKALKVAGEEYGRRTAGGRAISGIKDVKYLHDWCRSEYEERDPTSLEFNINYRDFIKFEITDQSLKRLTSKGVPNEVIDQLKYTESVGVIEGEKRFLEFVRTFIGDEYYDKYKFMIWRQALTRRRVEPTKAAQNNDKQMPWALGPMSNKELEAKIKELGDEIEELERERTK
jgi:outer membrane protein OmpA-like peptidoglycan-associated protein